MYVYERTSHNKNFSRSTDEQLFYHQKNQIYILEHIRILWPSFITGELFRGRVTLLAGLTQAVCMNFTTVTSTHVCTDYLTFEELRDSTGVCDGVRRAWQVFPRMFLENT